MAKFSSDYEKRKWESLQNSAGASLTNIVQGRATSSDFQRVTTVLNGLNGLAAQTFAHAISAAEVQAKKFEATYEKVRNDQAVDTLSSFEMALNAQLKPLVPEILSGVREIFALELIDSNDELERNLGHKFEHLQDLLPPKDLPTVNDVLAANELLAEQIEKSSEQAWLKHEPNLIEQIGVKFKETLRDLAESIKREREATMARKGSQPLRLAGPAHPMLAHSKQDVTDVESHSVMDDAMRLLGPAPSVSVGADGALAPAQSNTSASGSPLAPKGGDPKIALSQKAEGAITQAAQNQTDLYQKLMDFLGDKEEGSEQSRQDEQDKANMWARAFVLSLGDSRSSKGGKKKKDDGGGSGWLKALGTTLSAMVLAPEMFQTFAKQIQKYVTWDNFADVVSTAWNSIVDEGKTIVDWIIDKFNLKNIVKGAGDTAVGAAKAARTWLQDKLGFGDDGNKKTDAKGKPLAPGSTSNKKSESPTSSGSSTSASVPASASGAGSSSVSNALSMHQGGASSTTNATLNVNNRSSLSSPPQTTTGTTSVPANSVSVRPGIASTPPGSAQVLADGTSDNRPAKGTPQIGIGSFGFDAGSSDAITMMNTSYFTG